tara:strand:+ start:482 stop:1087 length:606 start_codon:yes stop_codon:yes gene_type:complete
MRKRKSLKMTTPKGTAVWPWLTEPNRKFDQAGVYSVNLKMSSEDAEEFVKTITRVRDEFHEEETKTQKKKIKKADLPLVEVVDDQGNETGEVELKLKMNASYEHDGKTITQRPTLIDTKQNPITEDVRVGSGTTMRCGVEVRPWYVPSQGVGVSLRLKVVQIIELVEFGGGTSGFDFDDEEGFETVSSNLQDEDNELEGMM